MALDLRTLRSFMAVASAGSISRAAERMHLAQPALSLQIKNLEEELGTALFDRTPKGVTPTAAGVMLLGHAADILKRVDVAVEEIRTAVREPRGRVAVGLPQSMAKLVTVPLVREVVARWPDVYLQIIELSTGYIPQNLLTGHIDIGMTFGGGPEPGLRSDLLLEEDLVLVGPPGTLSSLPGAAVAEAMTVSFGDLSQLPMILPASLHGLRSLIERHCASHDVQLRIVAEVNAIPELIALTAAGVGYTILSHAAVRQELEAGLLSCARIVKPGLARQVYICRSATSPVSLAVNAVWNQLIGIAEGLVASGAWPAHLPSAR